MRTGYIVGDVPCKTKVWSLLFKIINDVKVMAAEH